MKRRELDRVWLWEHEGTIYVNGDINDVQTTVIIKPDDNLVRLNIRYYSYDLEEVFYESVDLPIDAIIELAEYLSRLKIEEVNRNEGRA